MGCCIYKIRLYFKIMHFKVVLDVTREKMRCYRSKNRKSAHHPTEYSVPKCRIGLNSNENLLNQSLSISACL